MQPIPINQSINQSIKLSFKIFNFKITFNILILKDNKEKKKKHQPVLLLRLTQHQNSMDCHLNELR